MKLFELNNQIVLSLKGTIMDVQSFTFSMKWLHPLHSNFEGQVRLALAAELL